MAHRIAQARLRQRAIAGRRGVVLVDVRDGGGPVEMTSCEWQQCTVWFAKKLAPYLRFLNIAIILQVPFVILTLVIFARFKISAQIDAALGSSALLGVIVFTTWPLLIGYGVYCYAIMRLNRELNNNLAMRPRVVAPINGDRQRANAIEIIILVLAGPHLMVAAYGSIFPHAFNNTPWKGTALSPLDVVAVAALIWAGWRAMRRRFA